MRQWNNFNEKKKIDEIMKNGFTIQGIEDASVGMCIALATRYYYNEGLRFKKIKENIEGIYDDINCKYIKQGLFIDYEDHRLTYYNDVNRIIKKTIRRIKEGKDPLVFAEVETIKINKQALKWCREAINNYENITWNDCKMLFTLYVWYRANVSWCEFFGYKGKKQIALGHDKKSIDERRLRREADLKTCKDVVRSIWNLNDKFHFIESFALYLDDFKISKKHEDIIRKFFNDDDKFNDLKEFYWGKGVSRNYKYFKDIDFYGNYGRAIMLLKNLEATNKTYLNFLDLFEEKEDEWIEVNIADIQCAGQYLEDYFGIKRAPIHISKPLELTCPECGIKLDRKSHRHDELCPCCKAEHRREYMREYMAKKRAAGEL